MNVGIVTVLLVFIIAFTLSAQVPHDSLLQQRHGRRHHHGSRYEEKHTSKHRDRSDKLRGVQRKRIAMKPLEGQQDVSSATTTTTDKSGECCPTKSSWVELKLGMSRDNKLLEIYGGIDEDKSSQPQRFFEVTCSEGVEDKPCRFVARPLVRRSRCVQRYSYTYALVRDFVPSIAAIGIVDGDKEHHNWRMDHIKIRSGCSCEIDEHR